MCLCSESRRQGVSIVHFLRAMGAPTEEIEEWLEETGCYCDKIPLDMIRRVSKLWDFWLLAGIEKELQNAAYPNGPDRRNCDRRADTV